MSDRCRAKGQSVVVSAEFLAETKKIAYSNMWFNVAVCTRLCVLETSRIIVVDRLDVRRQSGYVFSVLCGVCGWLPSWRDVSPGDREAFVERAWRAVKYRYYTKLSLRRARRRF